MNFSKESIQQGRANQDQSAETPETFARLDGAAQPREGAELSKTNSRMAGEMGARALELMNNPNEQARVQGWMSRFGMTNQGMQWNQAKMGIPPEQE
jgi:hypothetical protein